ncbi:MAG: T9SS type A sorting domain-containing protein [Saprospiraceae bacterium]|nr:T9SS type A sorting domain-containing protein [Saprospiraceae bacterium]
MKISLYTIVMQSLILCILALAPVTTIIGQDFQRAYGTTFNNAFSKVIQDGSNYYVLGQDESSGGALLRATVTRLDATGQHLWTLSLNTPSVWNDGVITPTGDLLVVGATLPFDATNKSLIGLVTPSGGGNFTWVRSYDVAGRENLSKVVRNPVPQNASFPYYILGSQWDPTNGSAIWDDIILLNIDAGGTFNWKKIFNGTDDDEFSRDLEATSNGDLILAGNLGSQGVFIRTDNAGTFITAGTPSGISFSYADVAQESGGGFYAVGSTFPAFQAHIMKYDNNTFPVWEATIAGLTGIRQVWEESSNNSIYVTGTGLFNGKSRGVLLRLTDAGNQPTLQWVKFLDNGETSYQGGSTTLLSSNQISFVDGRIPSSGGFGLLCAFMSVSNIDLATCMTSEDFVDISTVSYLYNGPNIPPIEFYDFPTGTDLVSSALNWQQQDICSNDPCQADFIITPLDACGHIQVTNTSTGALPLTYSWCNGSSTEDLDVQLPCGLHTFCLTITDANGCISSYMEDVTVTDNVPPTAICALPVGVTLDTNCMYTVTPEQIDGGSFDNCQIQSLSVSPAVLTGCGIFPITLTVTDWCGNTSTCTTDIQTGEDVPPVITCPQNVTVISNTPLFCSMIVNGLSLLSATDNCSTPSVDYAVTGATTNFGQNDASGLTYNQGVSTITYTATDDCGNTATCSFTVTVLCPNQDLLFKCGMAVVTCFSGYVPNSPTLAQPNGPVLALVDIRNHSTAPLGINWYAVSSSPTGVVHLPNWESKDMGQIFGVTIDDFYNVYTSSTTMYGRYLPSTLTNAVYGNVYKIDAVTGIPTVFATLPQNFSNPAGLGDVWFDDQSSTKQIYVSNFFDGLIYRYNAVTGVPLGNPYNFPGTSLGTPTPGFVPLGDRVWAVATHNGRLYFSVWNEDRSRPQPTISNQIWSVQLDGSGAPIIATEILEKNMPNLVTVLSSGGSFVNNYSSPVSDISFSENGTMLISERSMDNDFGNAQINPGNQAHQSRIIELSGPGWATEKLFFVGNTNSLANSAGGIDYGYESFDPAISPTPLLCDSIIWGTGDALRYTGFNALTDASQPLGCSGGINDKVYGLTGIPQTGNSNLPSPPATYVKNSSIYIDLDNQICNADKAQIGDVDVFKNCIICPSSPSIHCDSLMVMADAVPSMNDSLCCYSIDFKNLTGTITQICATLTTPGWIFNTANLQLANGYTWNAIGTNQLCIGHPGGIPPGNLNDILTFCLAETTPNAASPQQIIFDWFTPGAVACKDTIYTECDPPAHMDTCLVLSNLHAECSGENDLEYCVTFTVTNPNSTDAYSLILNNLPPGLAFGDCGCGGSPYGVGGYQFSGFPLIPANTTQNLCVKIFSTAPILSPTTICFNASFEFGADCCSSTKDWCVELKPCCDPCESTFVEVHDLDSCCYALDFHYDCDFAYFSHIDIDILTPGVSFGSHANDPSWVLCTTPTLDHVCIKPFTGAIPSGTYNNLFSFCLTDINQPSEIPQQVQITYWTTGSDGRDSIACDTILEFNCDYKSDTCVFVTNEQIECIADSMKYLITVTVQNLSVPNFTAYNLAMIGPGLSPNPIPLVPPLPNDGSTRTVTFCYTPNPWPDADGQLVLIYRLKSLAGDTCCNGNQSFIDTLLLPPCIDSCVCGTFSDMAIRFERGPGEPLICGGPPVQISCPPPGYTYTVSGKFECQGSGCPDEAPFDSHLQLPDGTIITLPGQVANPYFGIPISNLDLQQTGVYTLTLTGHCGSQVCTCVIRFIVDPPCSDLCPCNIADIQAFSAAVNQGFSQVLSNKSCKACFTPIALSECETVNWYLTNTGGSPIGTSSGNNTFCYTFSGSGTYTVIMVVTRLKPDGTQCETFTKSQTVTVTCLIWAECSDSVFDNPTFSEGSVAGGLNSGGHTNNWKANSGNPKLGESQIGIFDNWTIELSGNLDTADVLTRIEGICLDKGKGTLRTSVRGSKSNTDDRLYPATLKFYLGSKETFVFQQNECDGIDCFEIGSITLPAIDSGEWLNLEIPYDLSNWDAFDACGGVLVRPYIFVTNPLSSNQGGADTYSYALLDNFCFDGLIVAVEEPGQQQEINIYPNPNSGEFTVAMTEPSTQGMSLRVISLTGQLLMEKKTDVGHTLQNINVSFLNQGMYFIQLVLDNRVLFVEKFVKQ